MCRCGGEWSHSGYLLTQGPYRYSCNPIYMAEAAIWVDWMAFSEAWCWWAWLHWP
jgi:protein-S-isoprenylcysteine O-methyltransferase Ste14